VRLLIDTHVFIWMTVEPARVRDDARRALAAPANTVFVSAASIWEIAIKRALGRLEFPLEELDMIFARIGFDPLPVTAAHGVVAGSLPRHHADPFDRMLVAQARLEDLVLVSEDRAFPPYGVRLFGHEAPR
jgi:PIN domain nuclease of toxin-antitoxin system